MALVWVIRKRAKVTEKSAQRKTFEEDTFPHFEALWRIALGLTTNESFAKDLVLKTLIEAYHSWQDSDVTVGSKARLFRILTREFFRAGTRRRQPGRFLRVQCRFASDTGERGRQSSVPSIYSRDLLLLSRISDVSAKKAVIRLKPKSRLIMILMFHEGFSPADIAYITGLRKDSVESIISRLRRLIPRYFIKHVNCFVTAEDNCTAFRVRGVTSDDNRYGG